MSKRKIWFLGCLVVTFSTIILLVTGSSLLTMPLDSSNTIPLGTFITWAGMISLPLSIYWGVKELRIPTSRLNSILAKVLRLVIILAMLWVPLSYLLAGNLSFSFSEKETFQGGQTAMIWFWRLSYGIGTGAVLIIFTYWISSLFRKRKAVANNV